MSAPDDELLRRLPLLRRVSPALRAKVAEVARLRSYDRGKLIFAEGDPSDAFIVIVTGRVKVFKSTPAGVSRADSPSPGVASTSASA